MKDIDPEILLDLVSRGQNQKEIALQLECSTSTISNRLAKLRQEEGLLTQYKELRHLHLTKLQAKTLEAITDDKIEDASFLELVRAFKILSDKEEDITSKGREEVTGLLGYLVELEKQDLALKARNEELEDDLDDAEERLKVLREESIEINTMPNL